MVVFPRRVFTNPARAGNTSGARHRVMPLSNSGYETGAPKTRLGSGVRSLAP